MSDIPQEERTGIPRGLLIGGIVIIVLVLGCAVCVVVLAATGILASTLPALPGLSTPTPTPAPTPTEDLDLDAPQTLRLTGDGRELLNSYESHYTLAAEVGDETGTYDIDLTSTGPDEIDLYVAVVNPDTDNQPEFIRLVILPEAAYYEEGGPAELICRGSTFEEVEDWLGFEADVDDVLADNLGLPLDSLIAGVPPLERVMPNEAMNGIESRHYAGQGVSFPVGESDDEVSVENADVDVWVAREGGFATRILYEGILVLEGDPEGRLSLEYDLISANQPVSVSPPPSCP